MTTLKKLMLITVTLLFVTVSHAQWGQNRVKGNGKMATMTRSTGDYDAVKCSGSFDYVLVQGTEGSITIEGEENLLEYVTTEVIGNSLIISTEKNVSLRSSKNMTIKVTIPYKDISKVTLSGSGDVWNEGTIKASTFDVSLSGSGDVVLNVDASSINGSVTGSGDVTLKGSTGDFEVKVTGSGDFHGFDLMADNVDASVTGSGDIEVHCKSMLKARVTGSGDIEYKGNPSKEDSKVSGSGSISKN